MAAYGTPQNPISIRHPLLLLPPSIPRTNPSLNSLTLFWCAVSTSATFAALTSLSTMSSFKSTTKPYTDLIIIQASLLISTVHFLFFFNLHRIPTLGHVSLVIVDMVFDTAGLFMWYLLIVYPKENSVGVAVFNVALSVDVLALTKLVNPRRDGELSYSLGNSSRKPQEKYHRSGLSPTSFPSTGGSHCRRMLKSVKMGSCMLL